MIFGEGAFEDGISGTQQLGKEIKNIAMNYLNPYSVPLNSIVKSKTLVWGR